MPWQTTTVSCNVCCVRDMPWYVHAWQVTTLSLRSLNLPPSVFTMRKWHTAPSSLRAHQRHAHVSAHVSACTCTSTITTGSCSTQTRTLPAWIAVMVRTAVAHLVSVMVWQHTCMVLSLSRGGVLGIVMVKACPARSLADTTSSLGLYMYERVCSHGYAQHGDTVDAVLCSRHSEHERAILVVRQQQLVCFRRANGAVEVTADITGQGKGRQ